MNVRLSKKKRMVEKKSGQGDRKVNFLLRIWWFFSFGTIRYGNSLFLNDLTYIKLLFSYLMHIYSYFLFSLLNNMKMSVYCQSSIYFKITIIV